MAIKCFFFLREGVPSNKVTFVKFNFFHFCIKGLSQTALNSNFGNKVQTILDEAIPPAWAKIYLRCDALSFDQRNKILPFISAGEFKIILIFDY